MMNSLQNALPAQFHAKSKLLYGKNVPVAIKMDTYTKHALPLTIGGERTLLTSTERNSRITISNTSVLCAIEKNAVSAKRNIRLMKSILILLCAQKVIG